MDRSIGIVCPQFHPLFIYATGKYSIALVVLVYPQRQNKLPQQFSRAVGKIKKNR